MPIRSDSVFPFFKLIISLFSVEPPGDIAHFRCLGLLSDADVVV